MIYKINAKHCSVSKNMNDFIKSTFTYLPQEESNVLHVTIEMLNSYTCKAKLVFQGANKLTQTIEVIDEDFYRAIEVGSKKMKQQLKKQKSSLRSSEKTHLGCCFEQSVSTTESDMVNSEEIREVKVPIYTMTIDEAIDQMIGFNYNVMMFTEGDKAVKTLVKQSDGSIKLYTGILA